jgi:hypothetical protein
VNVPELGFFIHRITILPVTYRDRILVNTATKDLQLQEFNLNENLKEYIVSWRYNLTSRNTFRLIRGSKWLRHYVKSRKVAGSILDEVN